VAKNLFTKKMLVQNLKSMAVVQEKRVHPKTNPLHSKKSWPSPKRLDSSIENIALKHHIARKIKARKIKRTAK